MVWDLQSNQWRNVVGGGVGAEKCRNRPHASHSCWSGWQPFCLRASNFAPPQQTVIDSFASSASQRWLIDGKLGVVKCCRIKSFRTVGNPDGLCAWPAGSRERKRKVLLLLLCYYCCCRGYEQIIFQPPISHLARFWDENENKKLETIWHLWFVFVHQRRRG